MNKDLVIKFCGDSGDGMQLVGTFLSNIAAKKGYQVYTYPSYPADMRAPKNSLNGVSSFQLHIGECVSEPGDNIDIMICMNPAAYKKCSCDVNKNCIFLYDEGTFTDKLLEEIGINWENEMSILENDSNITFWKIPATKQCSSLSAIKSRNIYMLGVLCYYLGIEEADVKEEINKKFGKKQELLDLNTNVLSDSFNVCNNLHISQSNVYQASNKVVYNENLELLSGCSAACKGLMAAAKSLNKKLFLGSYPITPASDILTTLEKERKNNVIAVQAEDEIAACSMAIGAACAGAIGVTSTSGPGLCLKMEAINLAVMAEIPLVVIDVMRGGPSTGLPTKSEQSDLNIALYGRSGDSPLPVIAANSPADCYEKAYEAVKIAVENCTPVVLLMDAYIGNGLEMTDLSKKLPNINISDKWHYPGNGAAVTLGGSEVDENFTITTDAANHENKIRKRKNKITNIDTPQLEFSKSPNEVKTLLIGWGSSKGKLELLEKELYKSGINVATTNFEYLNPIQSGFEDIENYETALVIEQNDKQFANYLKMNGLNKVYSISQYTGGPLSVEELKKMFISNGSK